MTVNEFGRCDNERPSNSTRKLNELVEEQQKVIDGFEKRLQALEAAQWGDPFPPPAIREESLPNKCPHCELDFSGTMGYVCSLSDCPMQTKVGDFPFGLNTGG